MRRRTFGSTALLAAGLLLMACDGRGPVVDVLAPFDPRDPAGPYEVTLLISHSERVTAARLHWYVGDGPAPAPLPFVRQQETDRWVASIPGQPAGAVVRWRAEVETDEGEIVRVPEPTAEAATPTFSFEVAGGDSDG